MDLKRETKNNIKFIEKEKFTQKYGLNGDGEYTPVYMLKNNDEFFIGNIVKQINNYDYLAKYNYKNRVNEIKRIKEMLLNNNGDYLKEYGKFDNPFDFVDWVKENNYTFEIHGELFRNCEQFTDFHGNLKEYSLAFNYRIYNQDIVNQLENLVKETTK